jgi:hypothetical protein
MFPWTTPCRRDRRQERNEARAATTTSSKTAATASGRRSVVAIWLSSTPSRVDATPIGGSDLFREEGERAYVVALGRKKDKTPIEKWLEACLAFECPVNASRMSWEQIYRALPSESEELAPLRSYFENKSYSLRRAFNLHV